MKVVIRIMETDKTRSSGKKIRVIILGTISTCFWGFSHDTTCHLLLPLEVVSLLLYLLNLSPIYVQHTGASLAISKLHTFKYRHSTEHKTEPYPKTKFKSLLYENFEFQSERSEPIIRQTTVCSGLWLRPYPVS